MTTKTFSLGRAGLALSLAWTPLVGCLDDAAPDVAATDGEALALPGPFDPPPPPAPEGRCFGRSDADHFGSAMAAGDFDGDGDTDLAVAAREDDDFAIERAGAVYVYRRVGTSYVPWQRLSPTLLGLAPTSSTEYGGAMVAADFDGDGKDELAIRNQLYLSRVVVIGAGADDTFAVQQTLLQAGLGTEDPDDDFGRELAVGDFDGDGAPDLVVAAPGDDEGGSPWKGRAYVFRGGGAQLAPWRVLSPQTWLLQEAGFGQAIAVGDFDGNGYDDLAVGMPDHNTCCSTLAQGTVVTYTSFAGNSLVPTRLYDGRLHVSASTSSRAKFGAALAAVDIDGDGDDDLAIAAPGARSGTNQETGVVNIYRNASASIWHTIAMPFPGANQGKWLVTGDFDGNGAVDLAVGQDAYGAYGSLLIWKGRINNTPQLGEDYAELFDEVAAADLDEDGKADLLASPQGDDDPVRYGYGRSTGMPILDRTLYQQAPQCVPYWGLPPVITLREARQRELDLRITSTGNVEEVRWGRVNASGWWLDEGAIADRTHDGLTAGTQYCYQGRTLQVGSDTFSEYSPSTCFSTAAPIPGPSITLTGSTTSSLSVRMVAGSGADRIRSQLQSQSSTANVTWAMEVTRTFSGLAAATQYCVVADSFHPATDEWSQERTACFTTPPLVQTGTDSVTLNRQSPPPQGAVPYTGWWWADPGQRPVRLHMPAQIGNVWLHFVKAGHSTGECFGPNHADATVTLQDGGTLDASAIATIQGGTPPPGQDLFWVVCYQNSSGQTPSWVPFDVDWENP